MPAPIAPWISASEALTIWMLSTAMKAPSVAPATAIQVFAETAGAAGAPASGAGSSAAALKVGWSAVIGISANGVVCFDNRGKEWKDCPARVDSLWPDR